MSAIVRAFLRLLSLACFGVTGCSSESDRYAETIEVDIGPTRTLCHVREMVYGCLNTRADSAATWSEWSPRISGFTFEWGYVTRVRITRVEGDPGIQDFSGAFVLTHLAALS